MAKNIVIVGGSLGGLCAGIALKELGHNVRILEKSPTALLHNQGAGIVYGSHTQEFFQRFDATHRRIAVRSQLRQFLTKKGDVESKQRIPQEMTSWDLLYHVLRANFDGLESDYVQLPTPKSTTVSYEYGNEVTDVGESDKGVIVTIRKSNGERQEILADLVIAADGPSSSVRHLLLPQVKRRYAGYVAWRGTVLESEVSPAVKETLVEKFTFFMETGSQFLCYVIPGPNGDLTPGRRLVNWVWYCNYPQDSASYRDLMTDETGQHHRITMPVGHVQEEIWEQQKKRAQDQLPPQLAAVVNQTSSPFVQSVTDVSAPAALLLGRKVVLFGDALAGFRPHTAASTSQAAFHALQLAKVMTGELEWTAYEKLVLRFAGSVGVQGVAIGNQSQFGR